MKNLFKCNFVTFFALFILMAQSIPGLPIAFVPNIFLDLCSKIFGSRELCLLVIIIIHNYYELEYLFLKVVKI